MLKLDSNYLNKAIIEKIKTLDQRWAKPSQSNIPSDLTVVDTAGLYRGGATRNGAQCSSSVSKGANPGGFSRKKTFAEIQREV